MPIPSQRFDLASWYDPDENKPGKSRVNKAALIEGYDYLEWLKVDFIVSYLFVS